jgi:uncharacterized protein with HEPN domain
MFNNAQMLQIRICLEHIDTIDTYFSNISNAEDLFIKGNGVYYDAILMRLQALCENLKKLNTNHPSIIAALDYPQIDDLIKFRDLVSHHYEKLKHEIIYDICFIELPLLRVCIDKLLINHS